MKKYSLKHMHVEILGVEIHTYFSKEDVGDYYDKWYLKKHDFIS
jgi:hypothetical protein